MDPVTVVQLALYVPFFLMLAIFAIVYLKSGYQKDLGRSLISLGATVAATLVSLLLAKGIGWGAAALLRKAIPADLLAELEGSLGTLAESLVQGVIEVVLSFLLFGVFFIVSLAVLKSVGKRIRWDELNTGKVGTRLAGMGIRAVDAVLVTVMLLLPLYGTLAMVAPPAAALMRMSSSVEAPQQRGNVSPDAPEAENEETALLEAVANHPALIPYRYGPGEWVYSGLSSFSMNGKSVDVTAAAQSLEGLLDRVQAVQAAAEAEDEQAAMDAVQELLDYTRNKVINQRWSYNMVMALVGEVDTLVEQHAEELAEEEEISQMYAQLRPLMDMSFEEYKQNAAGLLDFAAWIMEAYEQYGDDMSEEQGLELMQEMLTRIGDLLNCSDQAIGLKRMILQQAAQTMYDCLPDPANPANAPYYETRKELPNTAAAFIGRYFGDGLVPQEQRIAEAAVFLQLQNADSGWDMAEVFVRHPLFGADAVLEAMDQNLYIYGSGAEQFPQLSKKPKAVKQLDKMLKEREKALLIDELSFSDDAYAYLYEELELSENVTIFYPEIGDDGNGWINMDGAVSGTVRTYIVQGEDGQMYRLPDELKDAYLNGTLVLDEDTVRKYDLQPAEDIPVIDGDWEDKEIHFGAVYQP